jgi:hypothetical protein
MVNRGMPQVECRLYKQLGQVFCRGVRGCRLIAPLTLKLARQDRGNCRYQIVEVMRNERGKDVGRILLLGSYKGMSQLLALS